MVMFINNCWLKFVMNMKRLMVFGMLGLFVISMMGGVLGQIDGEEAGRNLGSFMKEVVSGFVAFFGEAFSADSGISEFLFFILLSMIIYTLISSFFSGTNNTIKWMITLSISTLAIIGIPDGYLATLLVSYGAMGLTILTLIPLMIILVFSVKVKSLLLARATWGFYAVYYVSLTISGLWRTGGTEGIYWIAAAIGIAMFFFVPYLRHIFEKGKLEEYIETAEEAIEKNIQTQKLAKKSREGEVGAATS